MIASSSNFREINMGEIAPGVLYRSNHPIYSGNQVKEIILSVTNAKIKTVINLSDSIQLLKSKVLCCPWYKKMLEGGNVIALNISMRFDIMEKDFIKKIKQGVKFMIEREPPYLIHCEAGMDRTGMLAILLESFMGANFDDMAKDYMLSFVDESEYSKNDYRNGAMYALNLFSQINGALINPGDDLRRLSSKYLIEKIGLDDNELAALKNKLKSGQ